MLPALLANLRPGQKVLFVRPLTEGVQNWKAPWTQLVRRRSAQWGAILAGDTTLRQVQVAPQFYRGASTVGNSAVLYEKTARSQLLLRASTHMTETSAAQDSRPYVILGGGPAGLTAGYLLAKRGEKVIVLESTDMVGGIARTEVRDGYRFDLGGHRFFTKVREVDDLWHEIMRGEFLLRPRLSRIYWHRKYLAYPLEGMDVIKKLGPVNLIKAGTPTCGPRRR